MKKAKTYVVVVAIDDETETLYYYESFAAAERDLGKGNVRLIERVTVHTNYHFTINYPFCQTNTDSLLSRDKIGSVYGQAMMPNKQSKKEDVLMYKTYLVVVLDSYREKIKKYPYIMARSIEDAQYQVHRMLKWDVNRFHIISIEENKED